MLLKARLPNEWVELEGSIPSRPDSILRFPICSPAVALAENVKVRLSAGTWATCRCSRPRWCRFDRRASAPVMVVSKRATVESALNSILIVALLYTAEKTKRGKAVV